ncbi:hypothetical protein [Wolbachia endosymbiont of Tettigetta isshikii]|uniref:hypothetical protein n=1 Tax=Wolbachia endosymbiont of Tettigetta isshikii TaxID=3239093 RepID=UPI00397FC97C
MHSGLPDENLDERLINILSWLSIDRNLLDYLSCIKYIISLLKAGANPNMLDQSGNTPLEYITEDECFQAIQPFCSGPGSEEDQGYNSGNSYKDDDKTASIGASNCDTKENSYKDEERISNHSEQHYFDKEHSFTNNCQAPSDDRGYGSDDEDEDSNSSSSDYPFLKGSLLMELGILLTEEEKKLIDEFCRDMKNVEKESDRESALRCLKQITEKYLGRGIRLNSCYGDRGQTVTNLIFEEMIDITNNKGLCPSSRAHQLSWQDISYVDDREVLSDNSENSMRSIISNLLLKGGKVEKGLFDGGELGHVTCDNDFVSNLFKRCKEIKKGLEDTARESIVNKSERKHDLKVEVDNGYFYVKYPQGSTIEPAKILNNEKAKGFNLKVSILQIGENVVRVEKNEDGKRNYTYVTHCDIEMSFTTEVGEISIHLCPSKEGNKKIEVKIDDENKSKFNKLKDKSSVGKNCLLEGESVSKVICKSIERNDGVETTEDVSSALKQVYLPQKTMHRG